MKEFAFTIEPSPVKIGAGVLSELGADARALGMSRVAFFTDRHVAATGPAAMALESLAAAGLDVAVYDAVRCEPNDSSVAVAADFVRDGDFDGLVSLGGGSVLDTAKTANLYATHPDDVLAYVGVPIGQGKPVPGPVLPHIACPTTTGTGAEVTGVAVFGLEERHVKVAITAAALRPSLGIVDFLTTHSLPGGVVAATGFDVLTNAVESYIARPFTEREAATGKRPVFQGANPWSDIGARATLRLCGEFLVRAVTDAGDHEARHRMLFAATYARIASGNSGVHLPHAMSYSVSGINHSYVAAGYEAEHAMVPHGISVILCAPAAFRFTAPACPERHLEAAEILGADVRNVPPRDAGEVLSATIISKMREAGLPSGLAELGHTEQHIPAFVEGAAAQFRHLGMTPREVTRDDLAAIYRDAMRYW